VKPGGSASRQKSCRRIRPKNVSRTSQRVANRRQRKNLLLGGGGGVVPQGRLADAGQGKGALDLRSPTTGREQHYPAAKGRKKKKKKGTTILTPEKTETKQGKKPTEKKARKRGAARVSGQPRKKKIKGPARQPRLTKLTRSGPSTDSAKSGDREDRQRTYIKSDKANSKSGRKKRETFYKGRFSRHRRILNALKREKKGPGWECGPKKPEVHEEKSDRRG